MKKRIPPTTLLRPLSQMEQAWTLTDIAFPLTAVCILKLEIGPAPSRLEAGLKKLQEVHPTLRVAIRAKGNQFWFDEITPTPPIHLEIRPRVDEKQWQTVAEELLNTSIDTHQAPMMRSIYLHNPQTPHSELLLAFHHAIVDAASLTQLLHQLLLFCAESPQAITLAPYPLIPGSESIFPEKFKGFRLWYRLSGFFFRQMKGELSFRKGAKQLPQQAIPASSTNGIAHFSIDEKYTQALIQQTRKNGISLPGLLSSALLLAVWELKYQRANGAYRSVLFSNLRPYLDPPLPSETLGCYLSMLRITEHLDKTTTLWTEAKRQSQSIYLSGKRGERYLYAFLSKTLVQMTLRLRNQRLGATALSYAGPLPLQPTYGDIRVLDIHGYISNNPFGASFTAFGKLFDGRLSLDLQYLTEEMSREEASAIAARVRELLLQVAQTNN